MTGLPCVHAIAVIRPLMPRKESWARYCSPYYHVNAFRATYAGFIFPFDNEKDWGKVQPENHVNHPPLERHPGHNRRTCPLGKGEGRKSKKSKQSAETNEDNEANETNEDNEVEPQNVDNNEGEPKVENVDNNEGEPQVNDIPITTRGGGRRGRDHNVNVHEVVNKPEVHEVVNDIPRATRGGRAGGRVGGTTGGSVCGRVGGTTGGRVGGTTGGTTGGTVGGTTGGTVGGTAGGRVGDTSGGTTGGRVGGTAGGTTGGRAENPRRYSTRSVASRGGGRGLGWWLGEDSQPPSTPGQSTPCPVFNESLTQSQPN
ncbi:hypothetical protein IFM89_003835 [Coptis chinensis]|uniref:Zinc finger PMZ-type domain-containing protein n=1 Tax=Coptis chinensis TaxID=261450 RepID=A0A835IRC4_9MAGN|nr:hypothetical protein IFM89_003835 [Coptis chinensis]